MKCLFWTTIFIIIYIFYGYPVFIKLFSCFKRQNMLKGERFPLVTLIIAAHNEEQVIGKKIKNVLSQDYPKNKLQIVIASDASTDRTKEIVEGFSDKGIELFDQKEHKGKSEALNYVVKNIAKGKIIIFNDATTFLEKDSTKKIISCFSNGKIGAVAGKLIFRNPNNSTITENHGLYWRYEEFLRESESKTGYLPFVSGAFYAIRKNLYTHVPGNLPDDSVSPLGVYKQGYSVFYAKNALAYETGAENASGEFRIKARGAIREISSIFYFKELLNPLKHPMISLVLISHRLMRWFAFILLSILFFANLFILGHPLYNVLFWMQICFYLLALCGLFIKKNRIISLPFYFCLVNIAAIWGIIQFLLGRKRAVWHPVRN